jgi:hypothetical protein
MADQRSPSAAPTFAGPRLLLGVFIVWQLLFLLLVNGLELVNSIRDDMPKDLGAALDRAVPGWPNKKGHIHDLTELMEKLAGRWASLTGQTQGWSLFAPDVRRHCIFPAALLRWDDDPLSASALGRPLAPLGASTPLEAAAAWAVVEHTPRPRTVPDLAARHLAPLAAADRFQAEVLRAAAADPGFQRPAAETLLSDNEPRDMLSYFRFGNFRLRRYEGNIVRTLRPLDDETPAAMRRRWRDAIGEHVRDYGDSIHAWLRWRLDREQAAHPGRPAPKQVILLMRRWSIVDHSKAPPYWDGPFTVPVARWQPQVAWDGGYGPLEPWDPVQERFEIRK